MNTLLNSLDMGGYALYVWSAYGLVFGALLMTTLSSVYQGKLLQKRLRRWLRGQK